MEKIISVFAGNDCEGEKKEYYLQIAYELGKLLAENGFTVASGAGKGLMDEVSRGAHEAGGKTIGIGLNIEESKQSPYISEYTVYDKLNIRQEKLIEIADAYIALPGGIGTVYEIFNIMAYKRIKELEISKPFLLMTDYFQPIQTMVESMVASSFIGEVAYEYYKIIKTPEDAIKYLSVHLPA